MSTPLVYIAGPYMGKASHDAGGYHDIEYNIGVARRAAAWAVKNGLYFICPHLNSCHFEVIVPEVGFLFWYELDIRLLSHCDAMLVVGDWESSSGTKKELAFCEANGIPIYFFDRSEDQARLLALAGA